MVPGARSVTVQSPWCAANHGRGGAGGSGPGRWLRQAVDTRPMRYEYKVIQIREGLLGGKMSGDKLEKTLNDQARDGWQLKAITAVGVKGRIGPGGVEGNFITFERPVALGHRALGAAAADLRPEASATALGGSPGSGSPARRR